MDEQIVWRIVETEPFELEREEAFLRLLKMIGPEYAGQWLKSLMISVAAIAEFPGPYSNPIDSLASERFGVEIRRLVYAGPGRRRRGGVRYTILYRIRAPELGDSEGILYILRVRHSAMEDVL